MKYYTGGPEGLVLKSFLDNICLRAGIYSDGKVSLREGRSGSKNKEWVAICHFT